MAAHAITPLVGIDSGAEAMKPIIPGNVPFFARRSMAAVAMGSTLYFFGGVGANTGTESILDVSNDLWRFATNTMTWHEISRQGIWPSPRRCFGWRATADGLYLWGGSGLKIDGATGKTTYSFLNDLWWFEPQYERWTQLEESDNHEKCPLLENTRPLPRYTPVFSEWQRNLILFGGYTEDRLGKRKMNDLWIRKSCGEWVEIIRDGGREGYDRYAAWPGLRYGSMSASLDGKLYICGGFSDGGDHIDLWELDCRNMRWRILSPDNDGTDVPMKRYCAAMVCFDGAIYLFGGRSRRYPKLNFNDLWRFSLVTLRWEKIQDNREPHRYDHDAAFPAYHAKSAVTLSGHQVYLWGGEGIAGHVSDFWRLDLKNQEWELLQAARRDDPKFW
jgi:hypothetical protein